MRDAQVRIVGLILNAVDGLDSIGDIGEIDKSTVPKYDVRKQDQVPPEM